MKLKLTPHQKSAFGSMKAARLVCGIVEREVTQGISSTALLLRAVDEYNRKAREFVGTLNP